MVERFDKSFWDEHWTDDGTAREIPANPHLQRETGDLTPGTALDAGCGEGAEAIWLASTGWQVTAADISSEVLARAAARASALGVTVQWTEADLSTWSPDTQFALVTTHYAHPTMPQLEFYDRISEWVAPGGTLLVVAHRQAADGAGHGHGHGHGHGDLPFAEASVTAAGVAARLDEASWEIVTAEEPDRTLGDRGGRPVTLRDVVVRARRRAFSAG